MCVVFASQSTLEKNKNMAPRSKRHGVGASVKVLLKFLHPSELVRNKYPNLQSGQRLEGCTTIRQEVKHINRRDQLSLVVTHNDFHNDEGNLHELHAVKRYFTVEEEGDPDLFFDAAALGQEPEGQQVLLPPVVDADVNGVNHGGANELIAALTGVVEKMMTTNLHLKTFQSLNQQQLLPSSIHLGDTVGFVFTSRRGSQTTLQNSLVLSIQQEMTSISNSLSISSPSNMSKMPSSWR